LLAVFILPGSTVVLIAGSNFTPGVDENVTELFLDMSQVKAENNNKLTRNQV
jgi:hypothetical protein